MKKGGYTYILASKKHGTIYIGVTQNLLYRVKQHRNGNVEGFSSKYNVRQLVYFEEYPSIVEAISREKQLKNWHRQWKINLVDSKNPKWEDLYEKYVKVDSETSSE